MATKGVGLDELVELNRRLREAGRFVAQIGPIDDGDRQSAAEVDERIAALKATLAAGDWAVDRSEAITREIGELQSIVCSVATSG